MTEDMTVDPLAGAGDADPREFAAAMVRHGMPIEEANAALATRKGANGQPIAPLAANSIETAQFSRDRLLGDAAFCQRYEAGDPAAVAELFKLDQRIAAGGPTKMTDVAPQPGDFAFDLSAISGLRVSEADVQAHHDELADLAAKLGLPAPNAKSIVSDHLEALAREHRYAGDPERLESYANEQAAAFRIALGDDAETLAKAASEALSTATGRKLDLFKIARGNGADAAIGLFFAWQTQQARVKR